MATLKAQVQADMKEALRAKDKNRLACIRLIMAAIVQWEVDQREEPDDAIIINLLDKMAKQRRESITQFQQAERDDLVGQEQAELKIIEAYLPAALPEADILALIQQTVESLGANSIKDMGKVMATLKPQLQGRADMTQVSALVKQKLT